jgi:ferrous iron transport protein A
MWRLPKLFAATPSSRNRSERIAASSATRELTATFAKMIPDIHTGVKKLSTLRSGEGGVVVEMDKSAVSLQLMEMGILPGEYIEVDRIAPLGDPISVNVAGCMISLRRDEAAAVLVQVKSGS